MKKKAGAIKTPAAQLVVCPDKNQVSVVRHQPSNQTMAMLLMADR